MTLRFVSSLVLLHQHHIHHVQSRASKRALILRNILQHWHALGMRTFIVFPFVSRLHVVIMRWNPKQWRRTSSRVENPSPMLHFTDDRHTLTLLLDYINIYARNAILSHLRGPPRLLTPPLSYILSTGVFIAMSILSILILPATLHTLHSAFYRVQRKFRYDA